MKKVRKEGYSGYSDLFECFLNDNRDTMKLYMCIYIERERESLERIAMSNGVAFWKIIIPPFLLHTARKFSTATVQTAAY